jgi:hypothetical protein
MEIWKIIIIIIIIIIDCWIADQMDHAFAQIKFWNILRNHKKIDNPHCEVISIWDYPVEIQYKDKLVVEYTADDFNSLLAKEKC